MTMYCCTCAAPVAAGKAHRALPCCDRLVCRACLSTNTRFATYCPYCQIATPEDEDTAAPRAAKDVLPPGLKPPPAYHRLAGLGWSERQEPPTATAQNSENSENDDAPPPYAATTPQAQPPRAEKPPPREPVVHYLDHRTDSVVSLSLAYGVPADALRRANHLAADYLLSARAFVQIPVPDSDHASPASRSPRPLETPAAARRTAAIRRFMVACKVADYDLALLYLEQTQASGRGGDAEFDVGAAVAQYRADEAWERAHPAAQTKGKARTSRLFSLFK